MIKRIEIEKIVNTEKEVRLIPNEEIENNDWKPTGQMLVDSDGLSFIYILEDQDEQYTYISIPKTTWSSLREISNREKSVHLILGSEFIELTQMKEELTYLINNIKGNLNYGEKMVSAVEELFFAV